jgi:hypothetical protein
MRYILLIVFNIPLILLALMNIVTQYKLKKITKGRFYQQVTLWVVLLAVMIGSYPLYNYMSGRALFDSHDLSVFDIVQTTAIVLLIFITNHQRQKIEATERRLRDLHQEISIKLSDIK